MRTSIAGSASGASITSGCSLIDDRKSSSVAAPPLPVAKSISTLAMVLEKICEGHHPRQQHHYDERTRNSMREIKISQPIVLTILLLVVSSSAQTQGQMNDEACRKYQQADAEMSRVYKQVVAEYKSETAFIKKLGIAQRAWLAFRDAHLEDLFPEIDKTRT